MLRNLTLSVLRYERVKTTEAKAKEIRGQIDRMINLGKDGSLEARRRAAAWLPETVIVNKVFDDLAKRYTDRASGYTRTTRLPRRVGDNAPLTLIELMPHDEEKKAAETAEEKPRRRRLPSLRRGGGGDRAGANGDLRGADPDHRRGTHRCRSARDRTGDRLPDGERAGRRGDRERGQRPSFEGHRDLGCRGSERGLSLAVLGDGTHIRIPDPAVEDPRSARMAEGALVSRIARRRGDEGRERFAHRAPRLRRVRGGRIGRADRAACRVERGGWAAPLRDRGGGVPSRRGARDRRDARVG